MPRSSYQPIERLRAIELLLLWEGRVSRGRLLDFFTIAPSLASRTLADFRREYPDEMRFDTASRSYIAALGFKPALTLGKFGEYVRLLGSAGDLEAKANVPVDAVRAETPDVKPWTFSALHAAVRDQRVVAIRYRSLRDPEPHTRTLRPHAFGQAGPRWHLRAYCAETSDFRDFNLAWIQSAKPSGAEGLPAADADTDWNTRVELILVPHEGLTPTQARLVRDEYCAGTTALVLTVRVAMLRYVIHAYRAALDPDREPAPDHLLMVHRPNKLPAAAHWRSDNS